MRTITRWGRNRRPSLAGLCLGTLGLLVAISAASSPGRAQTVAEQPATSLPWKVRQVEAEKAMVATVNPAATKVAVQTLRSGGNAVDAAVAAALMLGVVDSHNSGIGGGCFILIRTAKGEITCIDGREMAPSAAHRDMFVVDGEAEPELSQTGPLAVAIPGAVAAYDLALKKYGKKTFAELAPAAAEVAENGFELNREVAQALGRLKGTLNRFEGPRAIFFHADGTIFEEGELLKQPHLAESYRMLASEGADWFHRGKFASRVARWMSKNAGLLTKEDFANYRAIERKPLTTKYRGYDVVGFPPPSSGGVHVAQILGILQSFDIASMHAEDPAKATHVIAEAMELAFADRAYWLGDADFVPVPKGLISDPYLKELATRIDPNQNQPVESHGTPPDADRDRFSNRHTTHICVVDEEGTWVGITATVNTSFGSKVIVPGTGIFLNNEMDDFSIQPGVPNAFGLIGAENNAIAPGKRPLSSMSPTLFLKDGEPVLLVGAAGGPKIITSVLLTAIRYLDFGMGLGEAIAEPRFHHQWRPDRIVVEESMEASLKTALQSLGHELNEIDRAAVCQAIARSEEGRLIGVSDPRVRGRAAGY